MDSLIANYLMIFIIRQMKVRSFQAKASFNTFFLKHNGLPERWQGRNDFVIAELGFGSGLNFILTIREWLKHCAEGNEEKTLHYVAIEK